MNLSRSVQRCLPVIALAVVVASVLSVDTAWACPGCKQALADSKGGNLVAGYFWSILFMMSMPFTLLGGFSAYMYMLVRRARATANNMPQPLAAQEHPSNELEAVDV